MEQPHLCLNGFTPTELSSRPLSKPVTETVCLCDPVNLTAGKQIPLYIPPNR
jgi:hypothetical protein